jgi:hypothetical protein
MKSNKKNIPFILLSIVVILWILSWFIVDKINTKPADRGAFGDKFGFINSLFSGLALAGIIYSIVMQKDELTLQRQELIESREEFEQLNFDNTFFNLLKNQQEITNTIKAKFNYLQSLTKTKVTEQTGRDFFIMARSQMNLIYNIFKLSTFDKYDLEKYEELEIEYSYNNDADNDYDKDIQIARLKFISNIYNIEKEKWEEIRNKPEIDLAKEIYRHFFYKYHYAFGHYFRNLYHILKFLETAEKKELYKIEQVEEQKEVKKKYYNYAQFVQAQMSAPELFLLFYNCLIFEKLKSLVIKFDILENCNKEDLINEEHYIGFGAEIKSRKIEIYK